MQLLFRLYLGHTVALPRPFLDCHVGLTQSAATWMGVHPSLESPAVSSYIIAEPCWVRQTALCACHWMWLWLRLSGGWEATVKGFLPGLQQRQQNKQNQRFGERFNVARQEPYPLFTAPIVSVNNVSCYLLDVLCYKQRPPRQKLSCTGSRWIEHPGPKYLSSINQMQFFLHGSQISAPDKE